MSQAPHPRQITLALLRLIGEWRAVAGQQAEAIRLSDWPGVARLSHAKEQLKELMDAAIATSGSGPRAEPPQELRLAAEELVRLEQHNNHLLSERSDEMQAELKQSRAEAQRLRLIRSAYRRVRQTHWRSYL